MQNQALNNHNTKLSIEQLTTKQIICQCLDLTAQMLNELIKHYVTSNKLESPLLKNDLSSIFNYILQPMRLDNILSQCVKSDDKNARGMVKGYLFQMRNIRNCWAHNGVMTYRLCNRAFDTLQLLFDYFGGDKTSALYEKIQFYRRNLIIITAKNYLNGMSGK